MANSFDRKCFNPSKASTNMVARKGHQPSTPTTASRGHTKLTEKMKSFSLDCAEPPSHLQGGSGGGVFPHHRMKPLRSARAFTTGAGSLDHCAERSTSPTSNYFARRPPRRLPSVPGQQQQQQQTVAVQQQPIQSSIAIPQILHIVTHEYIGGVACSLRPGERLVVVDNGDPDWKHGFKLNYCSEKLLTFPSACIAAYKTEEEQPMRVTQTCNLVDQKMRLYRDQVVFVQPNSLAEDGRVTVRNEHDKFVQCPLQFLVLA